MGALFSFVAALAVLGLVLLGFVFATQIFIAWLQQHGTGSSMDSLVRSAETQIDHLAHNTIDDMFDLARKIQFERRMDSRS